MQRGTIIKMLKTHKDYLDLEHMRPLYFMLYGLALLRKSDFYHERCF